MLNSLSLRCPHGGNQRSNFWSLGLQIAESIISDTFFWLQKYSLYILDKHFPHHYYGLVINAHEIASHRLVPMMQNIDGMENSCALAINMIGTIIKDLYQTPKTGLKIMLVCYHLSKCQLKNEIYLFGYHIFLKCRLEYPISALAMTIMLSPRY